jgi:hypothetical protein
MLFLLYVDIYIYKVNLNNIDMPLHNGISSIIHEASSANTTGYTYIQVYAGAAATPTINGVAVNMAAGSTIDVVVKSISATSNVFVIGDVISTSSPNGTTGLIL